MVVPRRLLIKHESGDQSVENNKGSDRRKTQRFVRPIELSFSDGSRFFTDFIKDISVGGLQLESSKPLGIGTDLTITLATNPPVKLKGKVRWEAKDGIKYKMGVQFADLTPEQESRIRQVIQSLFWEVYQK